MASLVPGYEYDIFISYRQKDNKYDGWVSEFVDNLRRELEATFKEEISVYFDINPHDGLLDTHDVDASLKDKLNCLIFIPIISRTYCDPKSFAWEHEFKAFVRQATDDKFGLKIKLPGGNVAGRVLPVRIHDLDPGDIKMCESVLGGTIRSIDFVYTEPGVNRPLTPEDNEEKNLEGTRYRNQINKTANAIRGIIAGLTITENLTSKTDEDSEKISDGRKEYRIPKEPVFYATSKYKWALWLLIVFVFILIIFGSLVLFKIVNFSDTTKTVAVIPFTNPPDNYELASFSVGSMDAIISKLQKIKNITVRSRISSLQYMDTKEPLSKIRSQLKINYLIDISVDGAKDNLKMFVGLTKTKNNEQIWAEQYNINERELMPLFSDIVQTITRKLNVNYSSEEISDIEQDLTQNPDAYINYLAGNARLLTAMGNKFVDPVSFMSAIQLYDKAIEYDPDFANAYARRSLARSWGYFTGQLGPEHIEKCLSDIQKAESINKELTDVYIAYGFYYYYCIQDYLNALINFSTASIMDPEDYQPLFYMALVYRRMGEWDKSLELIRKVVSLNPQEPLYLTNIGLSYVYMHDFDSALIYHQKAIEIRPEWSGPYLNKIQTILLKNGNTSTAQSVLDSAVTMTGENLTEYEIILDIYSHRYDGALDRTLKSDHNDFAIRGSKYLYLANIYNLLNEPDIAVNYYDSAVVELKQELVRDSTVSFFHSYLGLAWAGIGDEEKAIAEGKKAIALAAENKNMMEVSDMKVSLALIYTMLGKYEEAIKYVEEALENPSNFSIKLMQIDPSWKPLLDQPDLKNIIKKYNKK